MTTATTRRTCPATAWPLLWLALLCCVLPPALAETPPPDTALATAPAGDAAELVIANRPIFTLRASVMGATPAERAAVIKDGLEAMRKHGGPLLVTTREQPEGIVVMIDERPAFRVLHDDVNRETGETTQMVAAAAVRDLTGPRRDPRKP